MAIVGAIRQIKGGEKKTTTTEELAGELALQGNRVLIIDMDYTNPGITEVLEPFQDVLDSIGHDTSMYRVFDQPRLAIDRRLIRTVDLSYEAKLDDGLGNLIPRYPVNELYSVAASRGWRQGGGRLDYIPGDFDLGDALLALPRLARDLGINPGTVLANAINKIRDDYDYILIDTAPSQTNKDFGLVNVLNAADMVICPLGFSIMAQAACQRTLANIRSFTGSRAELGLPDIKLGVLLCAYKAQNRRHNQILAVYRDHPEIAPYLIGLDEIKQGDPSRMNSVIPYASDLVDDAHESRVLPQMYAPTHALSKSINHVTGRIFGHATANA